MYHLLMEMEGRSPMLGCPSAPTRPSFLLLDLSTTFPTRLGALLGLLPYFPPTARSWRDKGAVLGLIAVFV